MRLTVETGPLAGTVVDLDRDHPTVLGRGEQCAIRVQEAGVEERHAVVKALKGTGFGIKALGRGLRVNGAEVEATPLQDGDVIELGTTRIAYGQTQQTGLPQIAGYRILDVLGKGGMGIVYRAEQVSLHREVALKVLNHEQTRDPEFVSEFVAEARAAAKLQHPNVVSVFDVENDGSTYYYAMELMHDGSCEDWLKQNGAMPVDHALRVIADAAAGLAYAESLGIVHRDIKPDNLMLDQHGAVKIADLGLASTAETHDDRAIGTPHFMAPEQVLKKEVDHRTDLYALGCTFYRLVTGKTPFRGQTVKDILRAQVKEEAEPAHKANAEVPTEVSAIIQQLMAKAPSDRYQTANDLLEELQAMLQPPAKRGLWIGLSAAAVLIAGGAIWWAATRPDKEIVREVKYDDPEKQQFADRIVELEAEAKKSRATIALLTTRLSDLSGEAMAQALDRVAAEHATTPAAAEAEQRAQTIRQNVEREAREQEARRGRIAEHLATMRRATLQPLEAGNFAAALNALDQQPAADLAGEQLTGGIDKLRNEILEQARARLRELQTPIATARDAADEEQLQLAIAALDQGLQQQSFWPQELAAETSAASDELAAARTALVALQRERVDSVWSSYRGLLQDAELKQVLTNLRFDLASEQVLAFADAAAAQQAADRARGLAKVLQQAEAFCQSVVGAAGASDGMLQVEIGAQAMHVLGWDRDQRQLTLRDPTKRGRKEIPHAVADLSLAQWQQLAKQVDAPNGCRSCFLGMIALAQHADAATAFLAKLQLDDDTSGTGDGAYPQGGGDFDQLLSQLPDGEESWQNVIRDELQAGLRLAAGLRALSERRNLAAAGHLEKLLDEHPHSMLVCVLP